MKHRDPAGRGEGTRGPGQRGTQNPDTRNTEPQWLRTEREQRSGWNEDRPPDRGQARYDNAYGGNRDPQGGARDVRETRPRAGSWEEHSRGYEASSWDDDNLDLGGGQRYQPFHVGTGMGLGTGSPGYGYGYGSRGGWDLGTHERDTGTGRSFRGLGPQDYKRPDERIREDIHERLTQSHDIDARNIVVEVSEGNVTLTGSVIERRMRYMAEDLVEGVTGVTNIDNQLQVQNGAKAQGPAAPDNPGH